MFCKPVSIIVTLWMPERHSCCLSGECQDDVYMCVVYSKNTCLINACTGINVLDLVKLKTVSGDVRMITSDAVTIAVWQWPGQA
jgi:hypothetical protein